jgi:hypothetical protein
MLAITIHTIGGTTGYFGVGCNLHHRTPLPRSMSPEVRLDFQRSLLLQRKCLLCIVTMVTTDIRGVSGVSGVSAVWVQAINKVAS